MPELSELLGNLAKETGASAAAAEAQDSKKKSILAAVRAQIEAGQTTGDPVKDFVLLRFGDNAIELERYHKLNDAVSGKTSELMVATYIEEVCVIHTFTGGGNKYKRVQHFLCGILTGESLQFVVDKEGVQRCVLPVKHFNQVTLFPRNPARNDLEPGPLMESYQYSLPTVFCTPDWSKAHHAHEGLGNRPHHRNLHVIAGDAAVHDWVLDYDRNRHFMLKDALRKEIKIRDLKYTEEAFEEVALPVMARWAGRLELTPPPEPQEKVVEK